MLAGVLEMKARHGTGSASLFVTAESGEEQITK